MRGTLLFVGAVALVVASGCDTGDIGGGGNGGGGLDGGPGGAPHQPGGPVSQGPEVCDGYDNDGNGLVDEGCACKAGVTGECYPGPKGQADVGICKKGSYTCAGDSEFGTWGACVGAVTPQPEICGNGIDEDCDGKDLPCAAKPDAGTAQAQDTGALAECTAGQKQPCYSGPAATQGKGPCKAGTKTCQASGTWGACAGEVLPKPEICNNWIDEDCDGKDQMCPGTIAVPVNISGDCITASCPPNAPHPVGCNLNFVGGDSRGCVANAPGSPVVYFQEGDQCGAGHLTGTLLCSSQPGGGINAVTCPINKPTKYYPTSKSGCPAT